MIGATNEHFFDLRSFRTLLLCGVLCVTSCKSLKFAVSDLEQTGDIRAALALCYRAQKDQNATGGGNTRNCDTLQAEVILFQRFETCTGALPGEPKQCLCKVYRICDRAPVDN
jgi:hypothetical protein